MTPIAQLDRDLAVLQKASARQDFAEVAAAARCCSRTMEHVLPLLDPQQAGDRLRVLLVNFESVRRSVLIARAQIAGRLDRLRPLSTYSETYPGVPTLRVEA
jgi:hypothetical protein